MSGPAAGPDRADRIASRGLDEALRDLLAERTGGRRAIVLPAPAVRPDRLWEVAGHAEPLVFWAPFEGPRIAGLGEVDSVALRPGTAEGRPAEAAAHLLRGLETIVLPGAPAIAPLLIGGAPFDASRPAGPFAPLGPGRLILPRWTLVSSREGTALILVLERNAPEDARRALLSRTRDLLGRLAATSEHPPASGRTARRWHPPSPEDWRTRFDAAREAIASGSLRKLVIAHAGTVEGDRPIDVAGVLAHLVDREDPVTVFGLRRNGVAFVGATPETLFSLRGRQVVADALAGTISAPAGAGRAAIEGGLGERLLASAKDRREQQIVVDAVREALEPLCLSLEVPARPAVRVLGRVAHLSTPISGELRPGVGWDDLVRALHPTPAVGGYPRGEALRRLAEIEPESRGWLAGPFGAVDGAGIARFAVAIRSALIRGRRAAVFAGAGIVEGSRARDEYDETLAKMRRLRAALGAPE